MWGDDEFVAWGSSIVEGSLAGEGWAVAGSMITFATLGTNECAALRLVLVLLVARVVVFCAAEECLVVIVVLKAEEDSVLSCFIGYGAYDGGKCLFGVVFCDENYGMSIDRVDFVGADYRCVDGAFGSADSAVCRAVQVSSTLSFGVGQADFL